MAEKTIFDFNINEHVYVKLTEYGKAVHKKTHDDLCKELNLNINYYQKKENEDGYSAWQLHELMRAFGGYMTLGGELLFSTTIKIEVKSK